MILSSFKYQLLIAATYILNNALVISSVEDGPVFFPRGAKSLFIGHSFFVPIAQQFDFYASHSGKFPDHNAQFFQSHGETGYPIPLWDNHRPEIERMLSSRDIDLFGMVVGVAPQDEESINAYKRWIDLALSYNPNTSIFIGEPWGDFPEETDTKTYMANMQQNSDATFNGLITTLRQSYPKTNIFFLNYGMCAGEERLLFDENKLVHVNEMIADTTDLRRSIYRDRKGHPGTMLQDVSAIAWLSWFYTGAPLDSIIANVKTEEILGWNTQNVGDILRVTGEFNEDYRLYGRPTINTSELSLELITTKVEKFGLRGSAIA